MNLLKSETSPYLLQHKDNPVNWHPWGDEAFEQARKEDKPILVSIGYSTCHWCHVMERESFTDDEVAEYMNEHFINIKVDREEHPDVDQFYMEAVQIITRSGGWPLNCFLTPEGKPFFGGTYFPPDSRYGRPSWLQVLQNISEAYQNRRDELEAQARKITEVIEEGGTTGDVDNKMTGGMQWIDRAVDELIEQWDKEYGGFGGAPKFPSLPVHHFLYEYACRHQHDQAKELVLQTLEQICLGGIYDQVGGGLCRYATDEYWNIPHFEKMVYDNAMLIRLLNRVYRDSGDRFWKRYLEKTVNFVLREWWDEEEGGFYSAYDADSEGEEGKYYVWSSDEWEELLPDAHGDLLTEYYQISQEGNWEEGKNIPIPVAHPELFAEKHDIQPGELYDLLRDIESKAFEIRNKRTRPGLDHKKILSWNAWMAGALVEALQLLQRFEEEEQMRGELGRFKELFLDGDEQLVHHVTSGKQGHRAYLDDYSALAELMIQAYKWKWDTNYLEQASELMQEAIDQFDQPDQILLSYSSEPVFSSGPQLPDFYDQTTPSGNAQAALNLWHLAIYFDRDSWRERAYEMVASVKERIVKFPRAFPTWLQLASRLRGDQYEIAIIGPDYKDKTDELQRHYIPTSLIMASRIETERFPLLNRTRKSEETLLYLCRQYSCEKPVESVESFMKMLKER